MCGVFLYVPLSVTLYVCILRLGERLDEFAQLFLEEVGNVQNRNSQILNNYFDVFDMTHVKHKDLFFEGKMLLKLHFEV